MGDNKLAKDKETISSMFDSIAPGYDFLNHTLSFQVDRLWRKRMIRKVFDSGAKNVLDLACGTADVSIGLHKKGMSPIGMDFSEKMLEIAKKKAARKRCDIQFINASADDIPFPDNTFDAVTIAFGIRNFDNREKCIQEIFRVMRPKGMLAILEFTIPTNKIWKGIYTFYFKNLLPLVGSCVSKHKKAYEYLPASAFEFPQREEFCKELIEVGFKNVQYKSNTGGIACLYIGVK